MPKAFGPAPQIKNPLSVVVAGGLITASVQQLEFVHERYTCWRLNKREAATDLFHLVAGYTVFSGALTALAHEPLKTAKHSLGIIPLDRKDEGTAWSIRACHAVTGGGPGG